MKCWRLYGKTAAQLECVWKAWHCGFVRACSPAWICNQTPARSRGVMSPTPIAGKTTKTKLAFDSDASGNSIRWCSGASCIVNHGPWPAGAYSIYITGTHTHTLMTTVLWRCHVERPFRQAHVPVMGGRYVRELACVQVAYRFAATQTHTQKNAITCCQMRRQLEKHIGVWMRVHVYMQSHTCASWIMMFVVIGVVCERVCSLFGRSMRNV